MLRQIITFGCVGIVHVRLITIIHPLPLFISHHGVRLRQLRVVVAGARALTILVVWLVTRGLGLHCLDLLYVVIIFSGSAGQIFMCLIARLRLWCILLPWIYD